MLTEEEKKFVKFWEENRIQKKKVLKQLSLGLPLSVVLVMAIFVNLFSGWYKRAEIARNSESASLILVLIIAALLIVAFVVIFSVKHRWDLNEQHYRELLARDKNS